MNVVALSTSRWREATRKATGVEPWCSPPGIMETLPVASIEAADVLYVNLEGAPGGSIWCGDGNLVVLTASRLYVEPWDLGGKIAFVASCYALVGPHPFAPLRAGSSPLHRDGEGTVAGPLVARLLELGCAAVVAGAGLNYGGTVEEAGVDLLGRWFLHGLRWGLTASRALLIARAAIAPMAVAWRPERDAFSFKLIGDGGARVGGRVVESGVAGGG